MLPKRYLYFSEGIVLCAALVCGMVVEVVVVVGGVIVGMGVVGLINSGCYC